MPADHNPNLPAEVIEHTWIPMPDGVRLSARLWLPEREVDSRVPVVLEYIPYRKRDSYRGHDDAWGAELIQHGIAYARIDVRGTGDSEGVIGDEYSEQELTDGEACIAWLAAAPWSNGRVGMRGISWGAINTLQIAARRPPALKAILPIAGAVNRFTDDAHYIGGLLGKPNLDWGVLFKTVLSGPPDPEVVGDGWEVLWRQRLAATAPVITEWMRHTGFDAYWQRGSVCLDYAAIDCPVYAVAGWHDTYADFVSRLLESLEVPCRGLIGPWGHTYPQLARPGGIDWIAEENRWWRQWLMEEETGILDEPQLRVFMPYATPRETLPEPVPGRWVEAARWPPADPRSIVLWLNQDGLQWQPSTSLEWRSLPGEPVGFAKAEWLDILPEEQSRDDVASFCFDSESLTEDLEILGSPSVNLRLDRSGGGASVAVRLTEVDRAGGSWLVTWGLLDLDCAGAAGSSGDTGDVDAPATGRREVALRLQPTAHRFKHGNRIRVAVSHGLWPMTCPVPEAGALRLACGVSTLHLPLPAGLADSQTLPFSIRNRPARDQPTRLPPVEKDEAGWRYAFEQPSFDTEIPDIGTGLAGGSTTDCRLRSDGRTEWRVESWRSWRREDWYCRLIAGCEVRADQHRFEVREYLRAYLGETLIYEQDQTAELPRRGT